MIATAAGALGLVGVYSVALLATLVLGLAAVAALVTRNASAAARAVVWRAAIVSLLLVFAGRFVAHAAAWVVPSALSAPLVALGRVQVTAASLRAASGSDVLGAQRWMIDGVRALFAVYLFGVAAVLLPTIVASIRVRRALRIARTAEDASAHDACLAALVEKLAPGSNVIARSSHAVTVPMTWGLVRPVIVLPAAARAWSETSLAMVLRHELEHVRAADWAFGIAARVMCAVYWFHPGAWWIARRLRADCELACDDRVISAGVRRSDYAELLVNVAESLRSPACAAHAALALSQRSGLRGRLAALLDTAHDARPAARGWIAASALATIFVSASASTVRLAPSRDVLTTLMSDTRWESRAYAVLGLAQRADSVAVARTAAERDPSPRVRAWARYALGESATSFDVRTVIHN